MSASPVLSVPCLPSCVSLSGGVRLSGLVCALPPFICLPACVSLSGGVRLFGLVCPFFLHLSPFICLPLRVSLRVGARLAGLVCALSPFMCLPEWWYTPLRSCLCLVSLDLSPVICLPSCVSLSGGVRLSGFVCALSPFICFRSYVSLRGGVRLSGLVCALSPFMCLPDWWCPPRRSCLCLVSLHVSPCVMVSASPVLSVPCFPSLLCVSLSGGVRLSGLVCALSPFKCLPEWWCPPLRS